MFIQEIIIDGFKSYAHRTTVQGFDPHFNAITGLNGSGKSNILDAICFVLGITNLSQVRAGNLSELVYKQGQAGVNKATVTIVFNNEDTANSPVGFEQCSEVTVTRQVLLGGKSKYLINGRNAPANAVQNLFHSVQLNVNNPHFLIMQGRITKVLNMKSHEILGMVEEAAGTRMYETKRVAALKTIEKKQAKLDEINSILEEEITPTLERLRGEKQNYLKWSKNSADVERIERFCVAHQFYVAQVALEQNVEGVSAMEEKIVQLDKDAEKIQEQIVEKDREIALQSSMLKGEMGGKLSHTKKLEQERSNELVRITSIWKNRQESLAKAETDLDSAKKAVEETQSAIVGKENEILDDANAASATVEAALAAEQELERLTLEYQRMSAGMSVSTEDRTLPEQISQAHADSKIAESKIAQANMKLSHLAKELKAVEKEIKKEGNSSEKLMQKKESLSKKVNDIASQISTLNFSSTEYEILEQQMSTLQSTVAELSERVDTLQVQLAGRLGFEYSDPVRGFDRSKVKGLVAKLIEVHDAKNATALEVVAGGKLFQVVVDEAITGKALLDRGKLKKRVTIIPLDKIQPRQVGANACQRAHQIALSLKATASPAIELVGFEEEVRSAIEYVFGSSIVVDGMKAANEICDITKTRTVTLEGDVYDPSGTISGGSSSQLGTTLARLTELSDALKELHLKKPELELVTKKIKALKADAASFDMLNAQLEVAKTELNAAEKHLSQTSFGMLVEKRNSFIAAHEAAEKEIVFMTQEKDEKWKLYQSLQEKESELTKQRENRLSGIEDAVKAAKLLSSETSSIAREASSRAQTLSLELESLQNELKIAKEALLHAEQVFQSATNDESESQMQVGETSALYEEARQELESLEHQMLDCTAELSDLKRAKSELVKTAEAARLESKKLSVNVSRIRKDRSSAEKSVASMLKMYSWIESEMSAFGIRGGDYDFEASDPTEIGQHLKSLKNEQDTLSKKINKKVMGMIEKAEGEYTELLRKRKVVENDKKKIQDVIKELDIKKKSELQLTWQKVNRDFGSVFSALLPGAKAKLEPPEGMEAWEGLEVKVSFGDVWKESLTELSGGQRSLLALSLILALLLFKPAPMYILDEVDAALDLSHTQNIGNMLKTHFSQSQFIVVSLKEGMFSNANVIFRTKFVDGVSTVTRTIGTGSSNRPRSTLFDRNEDDESRASDKMQGARSRKRGKENV